jgi:peroxiredoxin
MLQVGQTAPPFSAKPVFGYRVELPESVNEKPMVLCFFPSLESAVSRESVAKMQERFADFDRLGVKVVGITPSSLRSTQDFAPRYHVLFPLISDENSDIATKFGVEKLSRSSIISSLTPNGLASGVNALSFGTGLPKTGMLQASAEFVIAKGGEIAYARIGTSLWDSIEIDPLLEAVKCSLD